MRLVLVYNICADEFDFTCTHPFEYESRATALADFETAARNTNNGMFRFAGLSFYKDDFIDDGKYYSPAILPIDDWFVAFCPKQ